MVQFGSFYPKILKFPTVQFSGRTSLLLSLATSGFEATLILDDCPPSFHQKIVQRVSGKRLTVLTLYHEPESPSVKSVVLSPDDNDEVVLEILKADVGSHSIPEAQLKKIADFAGGFPVIARMMLDQGLVPTAHLLEQDEVAAKLLGDGNNRDLNRERLFGAHSLFRRIGGSLASLESQSRFIEETFVSGMNPTELQSHRRKLERRGLFKTIGDVQLPAPRPLAVAFAIQAIGWVAPKDWPLTLSNLEKAGLLRSFCERIGDLESSEKKEEVGKRLCALFSFHELNFLGSRAGGCLFEQVALLNPAHALQSARVAIEGADLDIHSAGEGWSELLHGLERIAWHPDHFLVAAKLIFEVAQNGPEYSRYSAGNAFVNFYHLALSGTRMPASKRLPILQEILKDQKYSRSELVTLALGATLKHDHFTRTGDATFTGVRDPAGDWYPDNYQQVAEFHRAGFEMLAEICLTDSHPEKAWNAIEAGLGGILRSVQLLNELDQLFKRLADHKKGLWPAAKSAIRFRFELRDEVVLPEHQQMLEKWLSYVTPAEENFRSRYEDLVKTPGHHYRKDEDGNYVDLAAEEATSFAIETIASEVDLTPYTSDLLTGNQEQAFLYGLNLARGYKDLDGLINVLLEKWSSLVKADRNPNILRGIARTISENSEKRKKLLESVAESPTYSDLLIALSTSANLQSGDLKRIRQSIVSGGSNFEEFVILSGGRVTENLEPTEMIEELQLLLDAKPEMALQILRVQHMYCYQRPDRILASSELFKTLLIHPNLANLPGGFRNDWKSVTLQLVRLEPDEIWLTKLTKWILSVSRNRHLRIGNGDAAEVLRAILSEHPLIVMQEISALLGTATEREIEGIAQFLASADGWRDTDGSPLWSLDGEQFRSWLRRHPNVIPSLLRHMPLFVHAPKTFDNDSVDQVISHLDLDTPPFHYQWHPHTKILLEEGIDIRNITGAIAMNLFTFGSVGSRVPYLEERRRIVQDLTSSEDSRLSEAATELVGMFDKEIATERRLDLNSQAEYM